MAEVVSLGRDDEADSAREFRGPRRTGARQGDDWATGRGQWPQGSGLDNEAISREDLSVRFDLVGPIEQIEAIAVGPGVKVRSFLRKTYGRGRWRKLKGIATVRLRNGQLRRVELHWYEAHGIGRRDLKIKRYMDTP